MNHISSVIDCDRSGVLKILKCSVAIPCSDVTKPRRRWSADSVVDVQAEQIITQTNHVVDSRNLN
jgi:hypothetical protein